MSTPVLPTLADGERFHVLPPTGLRIRDKCENRPDTMVGRLHYSLSFTLSAQFRWSVGASEVLTSLPSTSVLGSGPDYRETDLNRSIRHPTYPYTSSRDGGSTPSANRPTYASDSCSANPGSPLRPYSATRSAHTALVATIRSRSSQTRSDSWWT